MLCVIVLDVVNWRMVFSFFRVRTRVPYQRRRRWIFTQPKNRIPIQPKDWRSYA